MNTRIYPKVSEEMVDSTELSFDKYFINILDRILTKDVVRELSEERYNVLTQSIFDNQDNPSNFTSALKRYLNPDSVQIKKSFESLILCYSYLGVIPVTQTKLGEVIEQFIEASGGWKETTGKYTDAMKFRLPGSYENGKRR